MSTNIPFVDETWNPWQGCHKISAGCENCYMYREKKRYGQQADIVIRSSDVTFNKPLVYKPNTSVFSCSWSDFFIKEADTWRPDAWQIIRSRPDVMFVVITKRVDRIKECLPKNWGIGYHNVVIGFTAEDQGYFDQRWSIVREIPAARYLCMHEPALGNIKYALDFLDLSERAWIISGGETGPDARPAHGMCFEHDRNQAATHNVPFFFKQWGEWIWYPKVHAVPNNVERYIWHDRSMSLRYGSSKTGNLLDGKQYCQVPKIELFENQLSLF